jgi:glycosyltransferase involved in cell wall biosynthesis
MKIAQVAPLYESVPPKGYGGTERIVSYLTEALVQLGHDVTLYASGDSTTSARLRSLCQKSLRLDPTSIDPVADHVLLAERIFQDCGEFDFIHSHMDYLAYPVLRRLQTPNATTLHGRLDIPNLGSLYREFDEISVISISNNQRHPLSWAHWVGTVYHGLPEDLFYHRTEPGKYLAFMGRISPEKRVDRAIKIARDAGMPLKIAAKLDKGDQEYFERIIKPLLRDNNVEFIGEIGGKEKNEFLANAYALLFPIDWPEPFGLVMIEALACGTPVIARLHGSVPEVIDHGVTGFVVKNAQEAVEAVKKIPELSRLQCRKVFENKFTARRMAEDYVKIYQQLIDSRKNSAPLQLYG